MPETEPTPGKDPGEESVKSAPVNIADSHAHASSIIGDKESMGTAPASIADSHAHASSIISGKESVGSAPVNIAESMKELESQPPQNRVVHKKETVRGTRQRDPASGGGDTEDQRHLLVQ